MLNRESALVNGEDFAAMTVTPGGGGNVSSLITAFSSNNALFIIQNEAAAASKMHVELEYLRFLVVTADTGATSFDYYGITDAALRYSSGGQLAGGVAFGPINPALMGKITPVSRIVLGNVTLLAGGANRHLVHRGSVKQAAAAPLLKVGDEIFFTFGNVDLTSLAGDVEGTTRKMYHRPHGRVLLPPQTSYAIIPQFPGITVAWNFEYEVGWREGNIDGSPMNTVVNS